jgi:hypothetical protein
MSPSELNTLVQDKQLLRILQPHLCQKIELAIQKHPDKRVYVVQDQDRIYLCLRSIQDRQQRALAYDLVQRFQIGEPVDLRTLPEALRLLVQPENSHRGTIFGALFLGAAIGIICGVLGLAVSALLVAIFGDVENAFVGVQLTAVSFILCSVLGWSGATFYIWHKQKDKSS